MRYADWRDIPMPSRKRQGKEWADSSWWMRATVLPFSRAKSILPLDANHPKRSSLESARRDYPSGTRMSQSAGRRAQSSRRNPLMMRSFQFC